MSKRFVALIGLALAFGAIGVTPVAAEPISSGGGGPLEGNLTVETTAAPTIDEILAFFNSAVAEGTLTGTEPGVIGAIQLWVMEYVLEFARDAIYYGRQWEGFILLFAAYLSCDGSTWALEDVVTGEAAPVLASMIGELLMEMLPTL